MQNQARFDAPSSHVCLLSPVFGGPEGILVALAEKID
jgi:hypothetical protein